MEQPLTLKMNIKYIKTRLACMNLGDFYSSECFLLISLGYKLEKTSCAMHQHEGIKIELLLSHPIEKPRYLLAPLVPCFLSSIIMSYVAGINWTLAFIFVRSTLALLHGICTPLLSRRAPDTNGSRQQEQSWRVKPPRNQ